MRRFLFFIIANVFIETLLAGSISKRYTTFLTENGMLYFIRPMHMPKYEDNQMKYGMTFDITYLSGDEDSVSFTSTIVIPSPMSSDSVCIKYGANKIKARVEHIYCEPYKSFFISRNRYYIKWKEWKDMYENNTPYIVDFNNGTRFSFKKKKWEKERKIIIKIIEMIELNKKKK